MYSIEVAFHRGVDAAVAEDHQHSNTSDSGKWKR